MKKLFTLIAIVFVASTIFGQVAVYPTGKDVPQKVNKIAPLKKGIKTPSTRWYNYAEAMDAFYQNTSVPYGNNLFPDTTILVDYGTSGYSGPWIHALGDVLDVKSTFFNDLTLYPGELAMNKLSTFTVDSIGILCIYERGLTDPNIVDTLLIEVSVNATLPSYFFVNSDINTNLGSDTVFIHGISYAYQTNTLGVAGKKTYKFPLTAQFCADTLANGFNYVEIATSDLPTVNAGKYVATAISFIPGYTWVPNVDTLTQKNRFFFVSYKEQDGMFPIYTKKDYNISYLVPQDLRYNNAGTWNGLFIPSFAYMGSTADYSYEHHLFYYKTTCLTNCGEVGIENTTINSKTALGDAFPNPSNLNSTINIPVNTTSEGAVLIVKNILGQALISYKLNVGSSNVAVNTLNLPAGIYLYTLEADGHSITKKLSINK